MISTTVFCKLPRHAINNWDIWTTTITWTNVALKSHINLIVLRFPRSPNLHAEIRTSTNRLKSQPFKLYKKQPSNFTNMAPLSPSNMISTHTFLNPQSGLCITVKKPNRETRSPSILRPIIRFVNYTSADERCAVTSLIGGL